jgi:hypothetical protein
MGQRDKRGILSRLKKTLLSRPKEDGESRELNLYKDEFAPDDPVLTEIRDTIRAREDAKKEPPAGSSTV